MARHAARSGPRGWQRLRSPRVRAALGLGVVLVLATGRTWAHWSDEVTISGTTLQTGTIDLKVNDADTVTGYTALSLTSMVPGNSTASLITVKNSGSSSLKYTATSTAGNADGKGLGAAIQYRVTDGSPSGSSPAATCTGAQITSATGLNGGLVTSGRLLAAGTSESICVELKLPLTAAPSLQGATTSVGLTFTGTSDLS